MTVSIDEIFREVCSDVVIRFKGHDAYGSKSGALRAFERRAPGHDSASYESAFDTYCDVYDLAVIAIELFPANLETRGKYAQFEDIDHARCMDYITGIFPGYDREIQSQILNWVIFWHYLK